MRQQRYSETIYILIVLFIYFYIYEIASYKPIMEHIKQYCFQYIPK